jgi:hypothetical protein
MVVRVGRSVPPSQEGLSLSRAGHIPYISTNVPGGMSYDLNTSPIGVRSPTPMACSNRMQQFQQCLFVEPADAWTVSFSFNLVFLAKSISRLQSREKRHLDPSAAGRSRAFSRQFFLSFLNPGNIDSTCRASVIEKLGVRKLFFGEFEAS